MADKVQAIPEGRRSVTPHLVIKGAAKALDFYKQAFGADETFRMPAPDGQTIMHAQLRFGDCEIFVGDEFPQWGCLGPDTIGGTSVTISLAVEDIDSAYQRAVDAGATPTMPPADMFWGDRYGKLKDPFGHEWAMATHVRDVPPEEMEEAMKKALAEMGGEGSGHG